MKKTARTLLTVSILFFIMIIALPVTDTVYGAPDSGGAAEETTQQSSFEYKKYSNNDRYRYALRNKMKSVFKVLGENVDDDMTLPIPGLVETCTKYKGKERTSDNFVPQGLCSTGKYILVTAYDAGKKNHSAIYVIDKDNQELVSTLTLPNSYHVGGIAFDGVNIWLTGDTSDKYKGNPFVQYITKENFNNMIEEPLHEIRKKEMSEFIYIKNKPSFLECDNGLLWVGTYIGRRDTKEAYMNGYRIMTDDSGNIKLNTMIYSVITGLDSSAQGADIFGKYLYVSSSYKGTAAGVKSSFITKYEISPVKDGKPVLKVSEREVSRIEVPKMNEEILVDSQYIYINFESGSKAWKRAVINTDRILPVKRSLWG